IGRRLLLVAECPSTNDLAFETAQSGPADGLVVLSDYQTAGRGRLGRTWVSPRAASILSSAALEEPLENEPRWGSYLTLLAAVAACEAIQQTTDIAPAIRWPN